MTGLVDLHRHLDGSLRRETLLELAGHVPDDLLFHAGMGLSEALARFAFTLSVLQTAGAVRRVASEICEDAAREGVTTLEIRFAPQLHRGARIPEIVEAALEGFVGRAGLVLCGLYGEPPAVLADLVEQDGIVGIDLAGGPAPGHAWGLVDYAPAFHRAADRGLGRTVHAGEGRPAAEIRSAIEILGAQRIGHGTTLLDDPAVVDLVIERGVVIEACPTSNVHTGVIPSVAAHPIRAWLRQGVQVCVNSDNTLLSDTTAARELDRLGLDAGERASVIATGHAAAFHGMRGRLGA